MGRPSAGTLVDFLPDPALKRGANLAVFEGSAGLRGALTGLEVIALGGTRRLQSCKIGGASTTRGFRVCQSSRQSGIVWLLPQIPGRTTAQAGGTFLSGEF